MAKDRKFKNTVKIKEMKDISGILCIVLAASAIAAGGYFIWDNNQNKRLNQLEANTKGIDEQVSEQRAQIKKYFADYLSSDTARKDIVTATNISDRLFDSLEAAGINTVLTDEQIDKLVDLAMAQMDYESALQSASSAEYRQLYNTLYSDVRKQVIKNIKSNDMLTVKQQVTYDVDAIVNQVESRYNSIKAKDSNKSNIEATQQAYVETIVENTINNMRVDESTKNNLIKSVSNEVTSYLKQHPELTEDGKDGKTGIDGKDGLNAKDGYTPVYGSDYYTPDEIQEFVKSVIPDSIEYISQALENGENIKVIGIPGYSVDEDSLVFKISKCKKDKTAQNYSLNVTYSRIVDGKVQESPDNPDTITIPLKSVQEISYVQNPSGDDEIAVTYDNGYTESISIESIAAKYAQIYTNKLQNLTVSNFNIPKVGSNNWIAYDDNPDDDVAGAPHKYGEYYCSIHNIKLQSELVVNDDGTSTVVWGCTGDHGQTTGTRKNLTEAETTVINFTKLKTDAGKLITDIYNAYGGYDKTEEDQWNENTLTGQYNPLTQKDVESKSYKVKAIELAQAETLARYQLILDYMNEEFVTNQVQIDAAAEQGQSIAPVYSSLFDLYEEYMSDYDGHGTYGIFKIHKFNVTGSTYYTDGNVLKSFLTNEKLFTLKNNGSTCSYIRQDTAGGLTFNGDTIQEQLRAAQESHIIDYLMALNDCLANNDGAIHSQLSYVLDVFNHYEAVSSVIINGITSTANIDLNNIVEKDNFYIYKLSVNKTDGINSDYSDSNQDVNIENRSEFRKLQMLYEFGRKVMGPYASDTYMSDKITVDVKLIPTEIPDTWLDYTELDGAVKGGCLDMKTDSATVTIYLDKTVIDGLILNGTTNIQIPVNIGL